jgi:hypothetical protein
MIAWRRFPAIPDPPLPWLPGVARNLLRKQAGAGLRRREVQPGTARLLAYASYPVRAKSVLPGSVGLTLYEVSGWADQLGVAP